LIAVLLITRAATIHAAPPNVTSINPNRGGIGGGTIVLISGSGFTGTTSVTFGGIAAAAVVIVDDSTLRVTTPVHSAGVVDVVVANAESTSGLTEGYGYGALPGSVADDFTAQFGQTLQIFAPGVLSNDNTTNGGNMLASLVSDVTHGTLALSSDGSFQYTPAAGFSGIDNFSYRATNDAGTGNTVTVAISVSLPTTAQPPSGLIVSASSGNRITLRWTSSPVGLVPTDHEIEGGTSPGAVLGSIHTGSGNPIFTFDAPTGAFFFRVRAISGSSRSDPSNEIQVFVNTPAAPSAPENLTGLVNGSTLGLAWRNSFGGGAPTGLVLDVSGSIVTSLPLPLSDAFTFGGVPPGTYTLSLRATNAVGASASSNPVTLTFPDVCSGAPLAPSNFIAYKTGTTLFVLWDAPSTGPAASSYVLNVSGALTGSFPTTGRTLSGTVGAGSYTLSVTALNACGSGATTAAQTVTIP
jgi:hypothetical protein